jgi:hypothetical protein
VPDERDAANEWKTTSTAYRCGRAGTPLASADEINLLDTVRQRAVVALCRTPSRRADTQPHRDGHPVDLQQLGPPDQCDRNT